MNNELENVKHFLLDEEESKFLLNIFHKVGKEGQNLEFINIILLFLSKSKSVIDYFDKEKIMLMNIYDKFKEKQEAIKWKSFSEEEKEIHLKNSRHFLDKMQSSVVRVEDSSIAKKSKKQAAINRDVVKKVEDENPFIVKKTRKPSTINVGVPVSNSNKSPKKQTSKHQEKTLK
jgi:hypothetical protein